jgi:hypothetical protein
VARTREQRWLTEDWPISLLSLLDRPGPRKLRLFACACCRGVGDLLPDDCCRDAIAAAERAAAGLAGREELADLQKKVKAARARAERAAVREARRSYGDDEEGWARARQTPEWARAEAAYHAFCAVLSALAVPTLDRAITVSSQATGARGHAAVAAGRDRTRAHNKEYRRHCDLLRDLFGNPFRPACLDPNWLTWGGGAVRKLAQGIYAAGRFQDLPVLADALEEAGCTDEAILSHCRSGGEHVRGCWAVDLLLGKK